MEDSSLLLTISARMGWMELLIKHWAAEVYSPNIATRIFPCRWRQYSSQEAPASRIQTAFPAFLPRIRMGIDSVAQTQSCTFCFAFLTSLNAKAVPKSLRTQIRHTIFFPAQWQAFFVTKEPFSILLDGEALSTIYTRSHNPVSSFNS